MEATNSVDLHSGLQAHARFPAAIRLLYRPKYDSVTLHWVTLNRDTVKRRQFVHRATINRGASDDRSRPRDGRSNLGRHWHTGERPTDV